MYSMNKIGIGLTELRLNYKPNSSDIEITPPTNLTSLFETNGCSIAIDSPVTNSKVSGTNFSCEVDDAKLRFMIGVKRSNLVGSLPGYEHLATDQILEIIYNSDSAELFMSFTPKQIIRSVTLLRLKKMLVVGLCEQEWYSFTYSGKKAFVAVGPQTLCIDLPSTDGNFYAHLIFYRQDAASSIDDLSILSKILVSGDSNEEF